MGTIQRFKKDENTIWEDTDEFKIHNFPPSSKHTHSYIARIYTQFDQKLGWTTIEEEPIYLHEMTEEQISFLVIISEAKKQLNRTLKREKYLIAIRD